MFFILFKAVFIVYLKFNFILKKVQKTCFLVIENVEKIYNKFCRAATRSGKTKKNDKSQEKRGFLKKVRKFEKLSDFVSSNLQSSLFSKAFIW